MTYHSKHELLESREIWGDEIPSSRIAGCIHMGRVNLFLRSSEVRGVVSRSRSSRNCATVVVHLLPECSKDTVNYNPYKTGFQFFFIEFSM